MKSYGVTHVGLSQDHNTGRIRSQFLKLLRRKGCWSWRRKPHLFCVTSAQCIVYPCRNIPTWSSLIDLKILLGQNQRMSCEICVSQTKVAELRKPSVYPLGKIIHLFLKERKRGFGDKVLLRALIFLLQTKLDVSCLSEDLKNTPAPMQLSSRKSEWLIQCPWKWQPRP